MALIKSFASKDAGDITKEDIYNEIIDTLVVQGSSFLVKAVDNENARERLRSKITKIISEGKIKGIETIDVDEVIEYLDYIMGGYGILSDLIEDESISDIKVYDYDRVRVKRLGKRESVDLSFKNREEYQRFIKMIAIKNEIPLSDLNAIQTFTDKKTSDNYILRNNIAMELVNSTDQPFLQIRKIPKFKYEISRLKEMGMLNDEIAGYLINAARNSSGIVFSGKGASGKTTLMNTLLEYIPDDKSGLVIQENEELFSHEHPDMMFQHIVTAKGEGRIAYSLEDLARNGLLIDLDYFIIGEIKGNEAAHLMMANFTGHQAWTSVHGKSAKESIYKLADYVKQATDYSLSDSLMMLSGMQTIVYMKNFTVYEIAECTGYKNGELEIRTVFEYNELDKQWIRK